MAIIVNHRTVCNVNR